MARELGDGSMGGGAEAGECGCEAQAPVSEGGAQAQRRRFYSIWVTKRNEETDKRREPSDQEVALCLHELGFFSTWEVSQLMTCKQTIMVGLTAEQAEEFHIVRRKHGCCPRIKWAV